MKTIVNFVRNTLALIGLGSILFGVYLVTSGNITTKEVTQDHNMTVIYDGEVQSSRDWTEKLGYELGIDLYDKAYIGK
jgi:hypothetical protein